MEWQDIETAPRDGTRAYIGQRAKNAFYDYVMKKFYEADLTQAQLAERIGQSPNYVDRLLSSPRDWTIETIAVLLAAICAEELLPNSAPFGTAPQ